MVEKKLTRQQQWLLSLCIGTAVLLNWVPQIDAQAQHYLSETIASNALVFGVVRTLNGVISVVQTAEVGIGVAGIGVGEVLDPINDLIERFSGLLLMTLTALGIQQVLLLFTTSLTLKIAFSLLALTSLILLWRANQAVSFILRISLCCFIGRFLLSLEVAAIWLFDWLYFDATGEAALSVLEGATQVIDSLKDTLTKIDLSSLFFGDTTTEINDEQISAKLSTSVVTLIVGMLFKSLLIPIATLWAGYQLCRWLMNGVKP